MDSLEDYKVQFGRIGRTVRYEDSLGIILFAFDADTSKGQKIIVLGGQALNNDFKPIDAVEADRSRIDLALERTKRYLLSCGYQVVVEP